MQLPREFYEQEIKTDFRDLKLRVIGGYNFNFSMERVNISHRELEFISEKFPNDIISGSLALKIYGLLDRDINDIDILIDDKDRFDNYVNDYYGSYKSHKNQNKIERRLGYKRFDYKPGFFTKKRIYKVDFFENDGSTYNELEFNGKKLKIHKPMELIDFKISLSSDSKHLRDLLMIFQRTSL